MKGLIASMAEETVGDAALEQENSTGISSQVSSSFSSSHTPEGAGFRGLATAEDEGNGIRGGGYQVGDHEGDAGLELGLSLGARKAAGDKTAAFVEYCRILTAKDFPSMVASRGSSISSSSSTASSFPPVRISGEAVGRGGVAVAGTKRAAEPAVPEVASRATSQMVGWPPIRSYRMNSLMNQSRDSAEVSSIKDSHYKATGPGAGFFRSSVKENGVLRDHEKKGGSLFVKVNMDGMPIGRKVDLSSHRTYETLAVALEDMFQDTRSHGNNITRTSNLLDGSSDFVLTYEDKDGDWMLVGDVPWGMFLSTVRRLRIMRTSDATGLGKLIQTPAVVSVNEETVPICPKDQGEGAHPPRLVCHVGTMEWNCKEAD